jgi:hypothetical protein
LGSPGNCMGGQHARPLCGTAGQNGGAERRQRRSCPGPATPWRGASMTALSAVKVAPRPRQSVARATFAGAGRRQSDAKARKSPAWGNTHIAPRRLLRRSGFLRRPGVITRELDVVLDFVWGESSVHELLRALRCWRTRSRRDARFRGIPERRAARNADCTVTDHRDGRIRHDRCVGDAHRLAFHRRC